MLLHWVSVVILAKFHNPSILNPDFLLRNNIVPNDWNPIEVITTPPFSTIKYHNNITFLLNPERLDIRKDCEGFQDDYGIHDIAKEYINVLPHVNYTAIGLNWHISKENNEPDKFLIERFLNINIFNNFNLSFVPSLLRFAFNLDSILCNIELSPGKAKSIGKDFYNAIIINVNFHYQGPFSIEEIRKIIGDWKDRENYIKQFIPKILGISSYE